MIKLIGNSNENPRTCPTRSSAIHPTRQGLQRRKRARTPASTKSNAITILRVLAESPTLEDAPETLGINVSTLWLKRKRYKID